MHSVPLLSLLSLSVVLTLLPPHSVDGRLLLDRGPQPSMADWDPSHTSDRKAATKMKTSSKALSKPASMHNNRCPEPPKRVLRQILGPAFIDMYMVEEEEVYQKRKRRIEEPPSRLFYLGEGFREVLSDQPAWEINFDSPTMLSAESEETILNHRTFRGHSLMSSKDTEEEIFREESKEDSSISQDEDAGEDHSRTRRGRTQMMDRLFHCEAPIRYRDLGENYYPRVLREADCSKCSEEPHVQCTSRNFEVRVLRRQEECVPVNPNFQSVTFLEERTAGPNGMWRKWVLERLSISFCCVCRIKISVQ